MHYLIDGHNLIGQLDGLDLADPDDEQKLLVHLRRWTVADPRRQITLFFDGGIFRGVAKHLSDSLITVIFSSRKQTADALIIRALGRLKNPQEYTLVTSDEAIRRAARQRRVTMIRSQQFAADLLKEEQARRRQPKPAAEEKPPKEEPQLSEAEVAAWLEAFGPVPEPIRKPKRRPKRRGQIEPVPPAGPPPEPRTAAELKDSGESLRDDEIAEWLALFGPEPAEPAQEKPDTPSAKRPAKRTRPKAAPRPADRLKESGGKLSEAEVEAWLDIFKEGPD